MGAEYQRNHAIDTFRGICIVLMVLGHVSQINPLLQKYIYSFHLPAFFMLSGYLFSQNNTKLEFKNWFQKKFFRLLVPFFVIGAISGIPYIMLTIIGKIEINQFIIRFLGTFGGITNADYNFNCGPIWFLCCLFVLETVFFILFTRYRDFLSFYVLLIFLFGLFISHFRPLFTPFGVSIACLAIFYYYLGFSINKIKIFESYKFSFAALFLSFVFFCPYCLAQS